MMQTPFGVMAFQISENICDDVVRFFYDHPERQVIGEPRESKTSVDIAIDIGSQDLVDYKQTMFSVFQEYMKTYDSLLHGEKLKVDNYNIQQYKVGVGYPKVHYERMFYGTEYRQLTFITYLNDCDGGTEFYYQQWIAPAKKGLTIVFPADFLFAHRGVIDFNNEKMIATGWVSWDI